MHSLSALILQVEKAAVGVLTCVIFLLVGGGALARSFGHPQVWTDELAVHLMVMLAFIAASMGVALQNHMAMGLMPESLEPKGRRRLALVNQGLILLFMGVMGWLTWAWLDLPGLLAAGSAEAFAEASFNFVWLDPTLTLGVRKVWFWLVMPFSLVTGAVHALALLIHPRPAPEATA